MESNHSERWPEAEEFVEGLVDYDPSNPASIAAAREELRQRLGLDFLPILCSEPRHHHRVARSLRSILERIWRG